MERSIKRTISASGVIGNYAIKWSIIKLRDLRYGSESYELFIEDDHIATTDSVVEALAILVEEFSE